MRRFSPILAAALATLMVGAVFTGGSVLVMGLAAVGLGAVAWPTMFHRLVTPEVAWIPPASAVLDMPAVLPARGEREASSPALVARALGRVEARELAASPWFGVGLGFCLLVYVSFAVVWPDDDTQLWSTTAQLASWFAHPLIGMTILAVHRNATRARRDGADELFDTCPATPTTRTVGLLLTAWVPVLTFAAFFALYVGTLAAGVPIDGPLRGDQLVEMASSLVLCAGGVALGVALARWAGFGLAPVVAVVAIGFVSLNLAVAGDPGWNPWAELSTFPPLSDVTAVAWSRPHVWHLLWLAGLTVLVTGAAIARDRRDRFVGATVALTAVVTIVAGVAVVRPLPASDAARVADLIAHPAAHQDCVTGAGGRLEVCTFPGYDGIVDDLLEPVSSVVAALPAAAGDIMLRQDHLDGADIDDLPPEVARRLPDGPLGRSSGEIGIELGSDRHTADLARFEVALTVLGLPTDEPDDSRPMVIAGQARGVVALWLATRGMTRQDALDAATAADSEDSDALSEGLTWPEGCMTPPVVWSRQDLEVARTVIALPEADVHAVVEAGWARWSDPSTTTDQLLAALGLPGVGPIETFPSRTERQGC